MLTQRAGLEYPPELRGVRREGGQLLGASERWFERMTAIAAPGLTGFFDEHNDTRDELLYRRMRFIRRFEERLLELFDEGLLNGITHACIGQDADSVAVM